MNIEHILKSWECTVDESFAKAKKDLSKLVPVKKQVTKNGKSYMTTVYVSKKEAENMKSAPHKPEAKEEPKKTESKLSSVEINKHLRPIRKALGTEKYKEYLKAHGITWEENKENAGADTMRASSAAKKFLEKGGHLDKELFNHMNKGGSVEEFKKQKEQKKAEAEAQKKAEEEAKKKAEAEAKKKAEEEAKKKAEEEAKKKADEEAKKKAEPKGDKPKNTVEIQKQLRPIRKALGTAKYKEYLKAHGISWEENKENEGADTMRASSAAKKFLENGGTLDTDLFEHMKKGGKVSDYEKKTQPKVDEPKADEPKADEPKKKKKKTKKELIAELGDYFKPISLAMPTEFKKYEQHAEDPELKEFFEGLKEVATQEDFDKLIKSKGSEKTKVYFSNLTWEMRKHMTEKKKTFGVKGYKYGFGSTYGKLGNSLNTNKTELTSTQLSKVKAYTGSGYSGLNKYLRDLGDGVTTEKKQNYEDFAKVLNEVLLNDETSTNVMLYRGVKPPAGSDLEKMVNDIKKGNASKYIGANLKDHGFVSTTVKPGQQFSGGIQLHIKAPKGTKGKYINSYSNYKDIEYEYLLPSGTTFEIEEIRQHDSGQIHMLVTVKQ